jgi:hypothetical protein
VGIAATGFCNPGGILQLFLMIRSTNFAAAAAAKSLQQIRAGSDMVIIDKIFINNSTAPALQDAGRIASEARSRKVLIHI